MARLKRELPTLASPVIGWREDDTDLLIFPDHGVSATPAIFGILVGEGIYNLRAALDYLIYELALLDSGNTQQGTQFPIEDTEKGWLKNAPSFLKGVSVQHQTTIQKLQPYKGCDWTRTIRNLSNPDKHRTVTAVRSRVLIENAPTSLPRITLKAHGNFSIAIAFDDGSPVIETLQELESQVTQTLDGFRPEF